MEPKLPASNQAHEYMPTSHGEYAPSAPSIERNAERETTPERRESPVELTAKADDLSIAVPTLPMPIVVDPIKTAPVVDNTPLIANDDDLIEQEWVKKAKEIISDTKDDPYRRELEVGKLQADYLKKRYGKDLGAAQ